MVDGRLQLYVAKGLFCVFVSYIVLAATHWVFCRYTQPPRLAYTKSPFSIHKVSIWYTHMMSPFGKYTRKPRLVYTHEVPVWYLKKLLIKYLFKVNHMLNVVIP